MKNIKLSPDEAVAAAAVELDPLSTPCGDIDISRPVARAANYEMVVSEAKLEPKKDDPTRINVVLKIKSTKEITSTKNAIIAPGALVLTTYYPTKETDKMTRQQVGQRFAKLVKGLGLPAQVTPKDIIDNPSLVAGKIGLWKVGLKQETSEFPEGNDIKDIVVSGWVDAVTQRNSPPKCQAGSFIR